jgi:hypothetical protein
VAPTGLVPMGLARLVPAMGASLAPVLAVGAPQQVAVVEPAVAGCQEPVVQPEAPQQAVQAAAKVMCLPD